SGYCSHGRRVRKRRGGGAGEGLRGDAAGGRGGGDRWIAPPRRGGGAGEWERGIRRAGAGESLAPGGSLAGGRGAADQPGNQVSRFLDAFRPVGDGGGGGEVRIQPQGVARSIHDPGVRFAAHRGGGGGVPSGGPVDPPAGGGE